MALKNVLLVVALVCLTMSSSGTASRDFFYTKNMARLEAAASGGGGGGGGGGGLVECWNALTELKSCTSEIILFFMNGQANIGPDCCKAIDTITRNCWPAMLTSLGFTIEEGNILRGYCDASSSSSSSSSSAPAAAPLEAYVLQN